MAPPPDYQKIDVSELDGVAVVRLRESRILDERNITTLGNELLSLPRNGATRVLINFQGVTYLSSAALGKLISLDREIKKNKGKLKLCELSSSTLDVFKVSKLDTFFDIYRDQRSAIEAFY